MGISRGPVREMDWDIAIVSTYVKALGGEFDIKIDCDQFKACVEMPLSAITIT